MERGGPTVWLYHTIFVQSCVLGVSLFHWTEGGNIIFRPLLRRYGTSSGNHYVYSGEDFTSKLKSVNRLLFYLTTLIRHHVYSFCFLVKRMDSRENLYIISPLIFNDQLSRSFAKTMTADHNSRPQCLPASL